MGKLHNETIDTIFDADLSKIFSIINGFSLREMVTIDELTKFGEGVTDEINE